jgi:hypothetical protein
MVTKKQVGVKQKSNYTLVSAAVKVLKDFKNNPMSAKEVWDEIEKQNLYQSHSKTSVASLSTIMSGSSVNSKNSNKSSKMYFESIGSNPIKYKLINYVPDRIKDSLIDEGFITITKLKEILEKNNIKIDLTL